jgi:hypothetical protein
MTRKPATVLSFVVLCTFGLASAGVAETSLGTAFSYQGHLTDAGLPEDGTCDLQFALFDALSAGSQVGSTATRTDVAVSDGLFTVQLDFDGELRHPHHERLRVWRYLYPRPQVRVRQDLRHQGGHLLASRLFASRASSAARR